jgi:hypothetical membrane protein
MSMETPLVRRAVRTGGLFLAIAAAQLVLVALWVESRYPGYAMWTGSLRALGSSASPWSLALNGSLVAFGVLATLGLLFCWSAFDARPSRGLGLLALVVASGASLLVGVFGLEGARFPASALPVAGYVALGATGVGLIVLAFAMHRHERWRVSRAYTLASGIVVLASGALVATHPLGLVPGAVERVAVGAALLWALVEGLHIALLHRFAPGLQVKVSAAKS